MSFENGHALLEGDPLTVLVVDSYEPSRLGLGLLLQRESWVERCLVAASVDAAVEVAARRRPDVALLDLSDLGPFAASAVTRLRTAHRGLQVVVSAQRGGVSHVDPRAIGATGFVPAGSPISAFSSAITAAIYEEAPVLVQLETESAEEGPALSRRERDVLALLMTGATNREIAAQLYLGPDTVKKHASSVYRKLGVRNRTEATRQAAALVLR